MGDGLHDELRACSTPIAHGWAPTKNIRRLLFLLELTPVGDGFKRSDGLLAAADRCAGFVGLGAERAAMKPDKIPHL